MRTRGCCVLAVVATGILSGKYAGGVIPDGSRWTFTQRNGIFRDTPAVHAAVEAYSKVAQKHGMSAAQLALLWVHNVNGVTSTIIGATKMADIAAVLREYPAPF